MILGIDVSKYQKTNLPWPEWSGRVRVVYIQTTHGELTEPNAVGHLAAVLSAGYTCVGAYHYLMPGKGAEQADIFLKSVLPGYSWLMLDIEEDGATKADVEAFCTYIDSHSSMPLVLYGNYSLQSLLGENNPRYSKYGLIVADYGPGLVTSTPPVGPYPHIPKVGHKIGWQFTGKGRLSPYPEDIDMSAFDVLPTGGKPMSKAIIPYGSLATIYADTPGKSKQLLAAAAQAGRPYPSIAILNDAGLAKETKEVSPTTLTYVRYYNPQDDSLQGIDGWITTQRSGWCSRVLYKIYSNLDGLHAPYVDWCMAWNEEDPPGQFGWKDLAETFIELIAMNEARKPLGLTYVKLALGCLAQGTPELWEMQQMVDTGLFARMQEVNYSWVVHEGVFRGQAISDGYGDKLPSSPAHNYPGGGDVDAFPGSGSACFRFVWYFERLLRPLGQLVPLFVGEWYDGGQVGGNVPDRIKAWSWYDDRLSLYEYATGFAAFAEFVTSDWKISDLTDLIMSKDFDNWRADRAARVNGGLMPNVTDAEIAALIASNEQRLASDQADAVILAKYKPAPQPLYKATVLYDCILRDKDANPIKHPTLAPDGVVKAGSTVEIWSEFDLPNGYVNRAALALDTNKPNICSTTQAKGPSLKKL